MASEVFRGKSAEGRAFDAVHPEGEYERYSGTKR
jgi:hypothetical protein